MCVCVGQVTLCWQLGPDESPAQGAAVCAPGPSHGDPDPAPPRSPPEAPLLSRCASRVACSSVVTCTPSTLRRDFCVLLNPRVAGRMETQVRGVRGVRGGGSEWAGPGSGEWGRGGACRAQGAVMFSALTKKRMAEELEGFEQRSRPREQLGPDRIRPAAASTME